MKSEKKINSNIIAIFAVMLIVTGCQGHEVRESLGLTKEAPDEFMVLSRPALAVPPDFNLREPVETSPVEQSKMRDEARAALYHTDGGGAAGHSAGESKFISNAGQADNNIREQLFKEQNQKEEIFLQTLVDIDQKPLDPIVNPDEEDKRIAEYKEKGKTITGEATPVIERKPKAPLEELFD